MNADTARPFSWRSPIGVHRRASSIGVHRRSIAFCRAVICVHPRASAVPFAVRALALAALAVASAGGREALADVIVLENGSRIVGRVERVEPGPVCRKCGGEGKVVCPVCGGEGRLRRGRPCAECGGTGSADCPSCEGRGTGEPSYVILLRGGMRTTILESRVVSIERTEIAPEELLPPRASYAERLKKLGEGDAEAELALACWALERGLAEEAAKHAARAAAAGPALEAEALEVRRAAEEKLDRAASAALVEALEAIEKGELGEGARLIERAIAEHAASPILSDPARERAFLAEHAARAAANLGSTAAGIARAARRRAEILCPTCGGARSTPCGTCRGTGQGPCPACGGAGRSWCPDCNGTGWRVCSRCGGTGRPGAHVSRLGVSAVCVDCGGRGIVNCQSCKRGRIACPRCRGRGRLKGACPDCKGRGKISCADCLGTGLREVERFLWGPVREKRRGAVIAAPGRGGARVPVWQGVRRGCIITAVRARDLHDGALTAYLAAALGGASELLLLCVDNRDGREEVAFEPGEGSVRIVTEEARQVGLVPVGAEEARKAREGHPGLAPAVEQLEAASVLPGAMANVCAAFPEGTGLARAESVWWGREEPLRLERRYLSEEELARIRETLR
jgi:hypothetical protein